MQTLLGANCGLTFFHSLTTTSHSHSLPRPLSIPFKSHSLPICSMSAQPANNSALTPAEKRKITLAAKAEKARQEQAAFVAESKAAGGRKAKLDAKQNAVWNVDQPTSRKRTLSTAQVSEKPKKPRESKPATESDADDDAELAVPSKAKKSSKRKYAAPTITINTDESEPERLAQTPRHQTARVTLPTPGPLDAVILIAPKIGLIHKRRMLCNAINLMG
ncbi:hypothetical protein B0H10DRAFT_2201489 [Mycena sp. CBHHK59/15]|nr:hypothetical protein B0H10DRAFT_2201489 [Mycena sp. CBHHK59/15]